jgi:hypothetical protein
MEKKAEKYLFLFFFIFIGTREQELDEARIRFTGEEDTGAPGRRPEGAKPAGP